MIAVATLLVLAAPMQAQVVDVAILHPVGSHFSKISGISANGQQQVGTVIEFTDLNNDLGVVPAHATAWAGTAASQVNFSKTTPKGPDTESTLNYSVGGTQGGSFLAAGSIPHATIWGVTGKRTDLHPSSKFGKSELFCAAGSQQGGAVWDRSGNQAPHAAIWTGTAASFIDLTPDSVDYANQSSEILCTDGVKQGGFVNSHAALWSGTAASYSDVHPVGYEWAYSSAITGMSGNQQVGWIQPDKTIANRFAFIWFGSASLFVNVTPAGYDSAYLNATSGTHQCGVISEQDPTPGYYHEHAGVWAGTAASFIDLHKYLPPGYTHSKAYCIVEVGTTTYVGGSAQKSLYGSEPEAVLWKISSFTPSVHAHPADVNRDGKITPTEFTNYANAYSSASTSVGGVVPVPINYVTRAGFISKEGQAYHIDASQPSPLKWVPTNPSF